MADSSGSGTARGCRGADALHTSLHSSVLHPPRATGETDPLPASADNDQHPPRVTKWTVKQWASLLSAGSMGESRFWRICFPPHWANPRRLCDGSVTFPQACRPMIRP